MVDYKYFCANLVPYTYRTPGRAVEPVVLCPRDGQGRDSPVTRTRSPVSVEQETVVAHPVCCNPSGHMCKGTQGTVHRRGGSCGSFSGSPTRPKCQPTLTGGPDVLFLRFVKDVGVPLRTTSKGRVAVDTTVDVGVGNPRVEDEGSPRYVSPDEEGDVTLRPSRRRKSQVRFSGEVLVECVPRVRKEVGGSPGSRYVPGRSSDSVGFGTGKGRHPSPSSTPRSMPISTPSSTPSSTRGTGRGRGRSLTRGT